VTVRYGVVGCAGVGGVHGDAAEASSDADLVACADVDDEAAEAFADARGIRPFGDVARMIEAADVDAVSVCTPSGTHAEVTCTAAAAGAHVLCEKPLDVYNDRIDRMIDACDEAGVVLAGVFQRRAFESSRLASAAIDGGDLGSVVVADAAVKWYRSQAYYDSADWRGIRDMDGGCLMNQAIHHVDLLDWLGGGVETVRARTGRLAREFECEDTAVVSVAFADGALGSIEATTATRGGRSAVEINGTEGSITLRGDSIERFETADGERDPDTASYEWGDAHRIVVDDFVGAIREGRDPMVTGREARRAADIVLAAYESADRGGREVAVDPADRAG